MLKFFDPEKSRPSIDDGATAPEQLSVQQRVMKAVSLKNMAQRELLTRSSFAVFCCALPTKVPSDLAT